MNAIPTETVLMMLAMCAVPVLAMLSVSAACFLAVVCDVRRARYDAVFGVRPRLEVIQTRPMETVASNEAA
ncbi:MAG: hypothetical protein GY898_16605 [Proteobacteria bacterium]|nr:hypothetical protein [Pseudomonadota bacterium]